jgi:hypothetical protein
MIPIYETANGVTFAVRVHTRAKKNSIIGELGDALKLALTAPPIDGRANAACLEFFAKLFAVQRSAVSIASGETRRKKIIRVAGRSVEEVRSRLSG